MNNEHVTDVYLRYLILAQHEMAFPTWIVDAESSLIITERRLTTLTTLITRSATRMLEVKGSRCEREENEWS